MRKYIFSVLIALLSLPVYAQQSQAKAVLDKVADTFRKAGGVQIEFDMKSYDNGRLTGGSDGMIQLKGEKFRLETSEAVTWFDGETQWSYLVGSEEVNVTTPTQEELQSINPYSLLYMYQKGFRCQMGTVKTFAGKQVMEVVLTAIDRKQDLSGITLYVATDTYQPIFIQIQQRGVKMHSAITVTDYKTNLDYADANFVFDWKQYPNVEIIDLR